MRAGIFFVKKPPGMTSHDVVDVVRRVTGEQRVGHAGTLDPFATGVLVVGIGRTATKTLGAVSSGTKKSYRASIRLGATSDTDDSDGRITVDETVRPPTRDAVLRSLEQFRGDILQTPPAYSSIKIGGVRSYKRARRGEAVIPVPRNVTVFSLRLISYVWPDLILDVTCSSGTYIRSLARDLGDALGTGAYCAELVRTAVGAYRLQDARTLDEIQSDPERYLLSFSSSTSE